MPSDTENAAFAIGTTATCTATGFFYQLGIVGVVLSNASQACYYLLTVRNSWTQRRLQCLEIWLQGGTLLFALGTAVAGLPLTLYNDAKIICHIHHYPRDCHQKWLGGGGEQEMDYIECTRGENAALYQIVFNIIPLWLAIIFSIVAMIMIYCFVRKTEINTFKFTQKGQERRHSSTTFRKYDSKEASSDFNIVSNSTTGMSPEPPILRMTAMVVSQGRWYSGAFMMTYMPVTLSLFLWAGGVVGKEGIGGTIVDLVAYTFLPLQGFLNFLVFARKRETFHGSITTQIVKFAELVSGICVCPCLKTTTNANGEGTIPSGGTKERCGEPLADIHSSSSIHGVTKEREDVGKSTKKQANCSSEEMIVFGSFSSDHAMVLFGSSGLSTESTKSTNEPNLAGETTCNDV
jgi:hypothetical protein